MQTQFINEGPSQQEFECQIEFILANKKYINQLDKKSQEYSKVMSYFNNHQWMDEEVVYYLTLVFEQQKIIPCFHLPQHINKNKQDGHSGVNIHRSQHLSFGVFKGQRRKFIHLSSKIIQLLDNIDEIRCIRMKLTTHKQKNEQIDNLKQVQRQRLSFVVQAYSSKINGEIFSMIKQMIKQMTYQFGKNSQQDGLNQPHLSYAMIDSDISKQYVKYLQRNHQKQLQSLSNRLTKSKKYLCSSFEQLDLRIIQQDNYFYQKDLIKQNKNINEQQIQKIVDKFGKKWTQQLIRRQIIIRLQQNYLIQKYNKVLTYEKQKFYIQNIQRRDNKIKINLGQFKNKRINFLNISIEIRNQLCKIRKYKFTNFFYKSSENSQNNLVCIQIVPISEQYDENIFKLIRKFISKNSISQYDHPSDNNFYCQYGYVPKGKGKYTSQFLNKKFEKLLNKQKQLEDGSIFIFGFHY